MDDTSLTPVYLNENQKAELLEYYIPKLEGVMEQIDRLVTEAGRIRSFMKSIGWHDENEIDFSNFLFAYPSNGSWNQKIQAILRKENRFLFQSEIMREIIVHETKPCEPKTISGVLNSKDSNGNYLFAKQKRDGEKTRYGLTDWIKENGEIQDEYKLK